MKKYILLSLFVIISSCGGNNDYSGSKYYEGHIYDTNKKPLPNIKVCKMYHTPTDCTMTDANGYFKLNMTPNFITDLIVFYKEQPIDTIITAWTLHGELDRYSFIEGKKDTLFIDMSKYEK